MFVQRDYPTGPPADKNDRSRVHPSLMFLSSAARDPWVYVRTESGAEGWVSHDYLEHD